MVKKSKASRKPKGETRQAIAKPKAGHSTRQKINQLCKKKRSLLMKAYKLASICGQQCLVAIYDERLQKYTTFTSDNSLEVNDFYEYLTDP